METLVDMDVDMLVNAWATRQDAQDPAAAAAAAAAAQQPAAAQVRPEIDADTTPIHKPVRN